MRLNQKTHLQVVFQRASADKSGWPWLVSGHFELLNPAFHAGPFAFTMESSGTLGEPAKITTEAP
jgi:hypothetical protein